MSRNRRFCSKTLLVNQLKSSDCDTKRQLSHPLLTSVGVPLLHLHRSLSVKVLASLDRQHLVDSVEKGPQRHRDRSQKGLQLQMT